MSMCIFLLFSVHLLLSSPGAEVWKIENPVGGDDTRFWGPPFVPPKHTPIIDSDKSTANVYVSIGESAYFIASNRNKYSVAINFKERAGADIVRQLAKHADVLVENWMPGKLAEFGLDYDSLRAVNPSLIYASLTGFGPTGPLSSTPGYDLMASARGGLMHITGHPSEPSKVGVAMTDLSSGLILHGAILAALLARERDPQRRGQLVETNLLEAQVASLSYIGQNYHVDPRMVGRRVESSAHESIVPYQIFKCKPDVPAAASSSSSSSSSGPEYFICGALNNKQFKSLTQVVDELCKEIGVDSSFIHDSKYAVNADRVKHRTVLIPQLQAVFSQFSKHHLLDKMEKFDIPSAPINNLAQVFSDPQVVHSGIVQTVHHPTVGDVKVTGSPVHFSETPTSIRMAPPVLGQHTVEILKRVLGAETAQLKAWEAARAIGSFHKIQ